MPDESVGTFPSLDTLNEAIISCDLCPRLRNHCKQIADEKRAAYREWDYWGKPVPGFGDPDARLLIVGLAPAAHGANRTGRMFTGDSSGDWLYAALHKFGFATRAESLSKDDGLKLLDCYITAAAHCAPPDNKPTNDELESCRPYLTSEWLLLDEVEVVLALGKIGFDSWLKALGWWDALDPRDRPQFSHGAETVLPDGTTLLSSYHPSRQNTNTGRLTPKMWDEVFERARRLVSGNGLPAC